MKTPIAKPESHLRSDALVFTRSDALALRTAEIADCPAHAGPAHRGFGLGHIPLRHEQDTILGFHAPQSLSGPLKMDGRACTIHLERLLPVTRTLREPAPPRQGRLQETETVRRNAGPIRAQSDPACVRHSTPPSFGYNRPFRYMCSRPSPREALQRFANETLLAKASLTSNLRPPSNRRVHGEDGPARGR